MGKKDKTPKKPTKYNKFVKANYDKYGGDFKKIGAAWRKQEGNPKKKSTPKSKEKKTVSKPPKKTRTKGVQERKTITLKKELDDLARALGVPTSKVKIITGKTATTIQIGSIIKVKRKKRSEAMTLVRKRARARL